MPYSFRSNNPSVLRAAKLGLYGALAAETEEEFLATCTQALAPILANTLLRSLVEAARAARSLDPAILSEAFRKVNASPDLVETLNRAVADALRAAESVPGASADPAPPAPAEPPPEAPKPPPPPIPIRRKRK